MGYDAAALALSRLLKLVGDKKKVGNEPRAEEIRQLCEATLATVAKAKSAGLEQDAEPADLAAAVFVPLIVALETKSGVLVEESLDGLHELIAHGLLRDCADPRDTSKRLVDVLVQAVCGCGCMQDEKIQMHVIRVLQTAILSEPNYIHGASLLQSVRTCFNVHLGSSSPANQSAAKAALSRTINCMVNRMEGLPSGSIRRVGVDSEVGGRSSSSSAVSVPQTPPGIVPEANAASTPHLPNGDGNGAEVGTPAANVRKSSSVEEDDVYEIFYRLCKLSMKLDIVDSWIKPDETMNMQSKMLSLELLLLMLDQSGPVFRGSQRFINCIKQHLCMSLLKNGVSSAPRVFKAALQVFVTLLLTLKAHLKNELGVFFTSIFLRILESPNSTFYQKTMVLQLVHTICRDPQTVLDVYVNYDCDLNQVDILAKMLAHLTRIVQTGVNPGGTAQSPLTEEQELQLRARATDTLVCMLDSLVKWSKTHCNVSKSEFVWFESGEVLPRGQVAAKEEQQQGVEGDGAGGVEGTAEILRKEQEEIDAILLQKEHKKMLQQGIKAFALKPKKGLEIVCKAGFLEMAPLAIATWFHQTPGLDKKAIGDYMGEGDEFNKSVLYAYVDLMSFTGMTIDGALRHFLAGFWLPGEAQKIDRMMEKFAERFCKDTQAFANADTAYVLAYSIIMLNTDAHSPKIAKKMTLAEFIRNNRGINDGADLPPEFLEGIYQRITAEGFKVKEDDLTADIGMSAPALDVKASSHDKYRAEAQQLMTTAQGLLKRAAEGSSGAASDFLVANKAEYVTAIMQLGWAPMLAALSVLLEESHDPHVGAQCLRGMVAAILLLSISGLASERDAFVSTLTQFTNLHCHTAREVRQKNLDAIQATMTIARSVGNFLGASWGPVLRCISQLDRLQLVGHGQRLGGGLGANGERRASVDGDRSKVVDELNSLMIEELDSSAIDRIFTASGRLSDEAIVDFVRHLCEVSREEMDGGGMGGGGPRVFSMQKIVEITYYNMSRIRIVWSRIWAILGEHFQSVALRKDQQLSMYAIDAMRQLAFKFLEKDELTSFHFQRDFLKPFDSIIAHSPSPVIRELVVRCLTQVVRSTARNIKSGWKNIFHVLLIAARDDTDTVVVLAFDLVQKLVEETLIQVRNPKPETRNSTRRPPSSSAPPPPALQAPH
jgi:brefeldin A-inhibited guanine nucleotide-exchange protein